jgi:hypothetical protein
VYALGALGNRTALTQASMVSATDPTGQSRGPCVPASFSYTLLAIMLRDGAQTLSEVRGPVLTVVCEPCGRRERYDVERLIRQYGWDAKLTDLLAALLGGSVRLISALGGRGIVANCKGPTSRRLLSLSQRLPCKMLDKNRRQFYHDHVVKQVF